MGNVIIKPEDNGAYNSKIRPYTVHDSVTRDVIMIDDNKLNLVIRNFIETHSALRDAINYAAILLTLVTTLVTAEFKNFGVNSNVWQAIFLFCAGLMIVKIVQCLHKHHETKIKTVDDLVEKIKKDSLSHSQSSLTISEYK